MDLNFFNDLNNNIKKNTVISNFIKELEKFLNQNEDKNLSYIDSILTNTNLMPKYRDKLYLIRNNLLCNYSGEEKLYFVYGKNSTSNNYNVNVYQNNKLLNTIQLDSSCLPKNFSIDSILKFDNNKYILDVDLTNRLKSDLNKAASSLLNEQNVFLDKCRIENHIYEVVEKSSNSFSLIDKTTYDAVNNAISFEEFNLSKDLFDNAEVGSLLKFSNGKYELFNK